MSTLHELIQKVVTAVNVIAPESANNLNPPASDSWLSQLTDVVPNIPSILLDFLSLHNGEHALSDYSLFPHCLLMDINSILLCHQDWLESEDEVIEDAVFTNGFGDMEEGPVKPIFRYSKRVPFAWLNGGDVVWSLDLDPAVGGEIGQVVSENQENIDIRVIVPSLLLLLQQYLTDLETNQFSEEDGQITSEQWWPQRDSNQR